MVFIYFFVIIIVTSTPACFGSTKRNLSAIASDEQADLSPSYFSEIKSLYLQKKFSDVVLIVDNDRIPAHKLVLALNSEYFSALFYRGLLETFQTDVTLELDGASVNSFKILLKYAYSGQLNLGNLESNDIIELFGLLNLFNFPKALIGLSKYLGGKIDVHNMFPMFGLAHHYQQKELTAESLNFMDSHALRILQSQDFLSLPPEAIQKILIRDTFYTPELDIFRAVCRWIKEHKDNIDLEDRTKVLSNVRITLINIEELLTVIEETQLDNLDILEAVELRKLLSSRKRETPRHPNPNSIASSSQATRKIIHKYGGTNYYDN
ncbi:BTB/POZ domain-containing protein 9-like [Adelges cooleyi]|uniref:BTB/POZ domain-containing protein 9-like n=1 Tax=Adelges cooleyi TaxID=133065 RepID=UPI00218062A7|nr:BTB/POZ domain-containing protein 9-like [Adelges cooleyi]